MANPQIAKAVLIPMNGDQPDADQSKYILVQFNPATLKVGLSNSLKADNAGGNTPTAAQYVEKSESTLAVQLLFDTTVARDANFTFNDADGAERTASARHEANSDVRVLTKAIAGTFMQPQNPESEQPSAPLRCRFQWGAFAFVGMLSGYNETLDFFSPEGIPLRATLALTFKEDRYQFETLAVSAAKRETPTFAAGSDDISAADAAGNAGKKPADWRDVALFNGLENPRLSASAGLSIPGVSLQASAGLSAGAALSAKSGFSAGASASLGTDIPGAFVSIGASASLPGLDVDVDVPAPGIDIDAEFNL